MNKILYAFRMPMVAIAAFALVKCSENKAEAPRKPTREEAIPVRLADIHHDSYGRTLQYSGTIGSNTESRLSFKIGGIVSKIFVKAGDRVSAGQVLATLDLTEIDAQVRQATQNLEKATRDAGRVNNLYNDTVASLEQVQNSGTQVGLATEALRIAQFNRQYAQIRATGAGAILSKFLNEGEYASTGTAVLLFNGTAGNDWVVRPGVSDKDWALLRVGDQADIRIDAYPDRSFAGVVTRMAQGADPASGTYPVEIKVTPGNARFAPGLFCSVRLRPAQHRTLTMIPIEAMAEGDGKTGYVYTLNADNRTVRKNLIHIAYLENDRIAVSSGLENVSRLITEGVGYLTETSVVKPMN